MKMAISPLRLIGDEELKQCLFYGYDKIYDKELGDIVQGKIEELVAQEDALDFLFYHPSPFQALCLRCVMLVRQKNPEKRVRLIRVFNPAKDAPQGHGDWYRLAASTGFPLCFFDDVQMVQELPGKAAKNPNLFATQQNKVERWLFQQCDYLFVYNYPNVPESDGTQIKYARSSCSATVIPLINEETLAALDRMIDGMEERERSVLQGLRDGETQATVGKRIGVSSNRVSQIAHKASLKLRRELESQFYILNRREEHPTYLCSLAGLGDATAVKMAVFKGLIKMIRDVYGVSGFQIMDMDSDSAFGEALVSNAMQPLYIGGSSKNVAVNVLQSIEETDDAWQADAYERLPSLYDGIVHYSAETEQQPSMEAVCGRAMEESIFFITDLTAVPGIASSLQDTCAKTKDCVLIDLSKYRRIWEAMK